MLFTKDRQPIDAEARFWKKNNLVKFDVSGQLPPDEEREFTGLWNRQSIPNGSIIKPLTADEMKRLKYLYEKKQRR